MSSQNSLRSLHNSPAPSSDLEQSAVEPSLSTNTHHNTHVTEVSRHLSSSQHTCHRGQSPPLLITTHMYPEVCRYLSSSQHTCHRGRSPPLLITKSPPLLITTHMYTEVSRPPLLTFIFSVNSSSSSFSRLPSICNHNTLKEGTFIRKK